LRNDFIGITADTKTDNFVLSTAAGYDIKRLRTNRAG
jgi:hypothetical protein